MSPASVEVVPSGTTWTVRILEHGVIRELSFAFQSYAASFAHGQRMRLGLAGPLPDWAQQIRMPVGPCAIALDDRLTDQQ